MWRVFVCGVLAVLSILPLRALDPSYNIAAFAASGSTSRLSYHWDAMAGGVPVVASTPRATMPYAPAPLTTISYDAGNPALYQEKTIGGVDYECVLVGTFTNPNDFWNKAPGTELTLTYTTGTTTHYIFPYVTVGGDLHSYLSDTYFSSSSMPTNDDVAWRIDQSLGLNPETSLTSRGMAFFWVPVTDIVRSGYSPDVSAQVEDLATFSDGSYRPTEGGLPSGFQYVDYSDNTIRYGTNEEFVAYNQAQTGYPWTAMGYTFNWNALQDGSNSALYGYDPLAPSSYVGLSEFMVSGGSAVLLESWVPHENLGLWVIPEPGTVLYLLAGALLFVIRGRRVRLA